MPRVLDTGGRTAKREDLHAMDPRGIIFDIESNTRWHPPGQDMPLDLNKVVEYAKQFIDPKIGQLQPIGLRIAEGRKPKVMYGFHRLAAALMVVDGSEEHGIAAHPEFLVRAVIKNLNDGEALEAAIRENRSRVGTTPIDDAENLRRLRNLGREDDAISRILDCSIGWIGKLEKLLSLPDDIKLATHNRILTVDNAISLSDMSKEDQDRVLAETVKNVQTNIDNDFGTDVSPEVTATLRKMALTTEVARGEAPTDPKGNPLPPKRQLNSALRKQIKADRVEKGKKVTLGRGEIIIYWQTIIDDEKATESEKILAKGIIEHVNGKRGDQSLRNILTRVLRVAPKDKDKE